MIAQSMDDISGEFWRRTGYQKVEARCLLMEKGFTHLERYNGMAGDAFLWGEEKWMGEFS